MNLSLKVVRIAILFVTISFLKTVSADSYLSACRVPSNYQLLDGFNLQFYNYPAYGVEAANSDFYVSGYTAFW